MCRSYNLLSFIFVATTMFSLNSIKVKALYVTKFSAVRFASKKAMSTGTVLNAAHTSVMNPVRVRFAPSPTGSLHVGGARTALYNWLLAKKTNGKFIIRVEDTDLDRSTKDSETSILNDLKWLNLHWDEGPGINGPHAPYRQSERKEIYAQAAEKLINEGKAYRCFCTEEELEVMRASAESADSAPDENGGGYYNTWRDADPKEVQARLDSGEPYVVRFRVPQGKVVSILDKVRGVVSWETDAALRGDFVIMRSNGMPVYNFCVSVDDAEMQITHVVRAEEHLSNTLRQMLILEAMRVKPPVYAHCSLILGTDRSKLSKRHGATSVQQFSEQGYVPEAMLNYLANLGWNDGTDKEIYTPEELVHAFDLSRIVKSSAVFDLDKLRWINAQHLRMRASEALQPLVLQDLCAASTDSSPPLLPDSFLSDTSTQPATFGAFMKLATMIAQRDMELLTDSKRLVANCLQYDVEHTLHTDEHVEEIIRAESFPAVVSALLHDYQSGTLPRGTETDFSALWKAYMKDLGKRTGLKGKALFHPVRLCLTGRVSGPDVGDQLQLVALSKGLLHRAYSACVDLANRMEKLREFSVTDALEVVAKSKVERQNVAQQL